MSFTPKFVDLVKNSTSVQGTANVVLGAAPAGFTGFGQACVAGDQFYYCIQGSDKPAEREIGKGTMQADGTIARATADGSALTKFTSGAKTIALVAASDWFAKVEAAAGKDGMLVDTRAALAALAAPAAGQVRMLGEARRTGLFRFEAGDRTALVAADPRQGLAVAPASDPTGAGGAWMRQVDGPSSALWFGAVADDTGTAGTDNSPALAAALTALAAAGTDQSAGGNPSRGGAVLHIPAGKYYCATTIELTASSVTIEGDGGFGSGQKATMLRFAAGQTGIRGQRSNTFGAAGYDMTQRYPGADYSTVRRLALSGGYGGNDGDFHGIHLRCRMHVEDVSVSNFEGDGIRIEASAPNGNANSWSVTRCLLSQNRNGLVAIGADANAGTASRVDASFNRLFGIDDYSFLGNSYSGCHGLSNGVVGPKGGVNHNGQCYTVVPGMEAAATTNAPSGTTADNGWWRWVATFSQVAWPAWSNGMAETAPSGTYRSRNRTVATVFRDCYSEGSGPNLVAYPAYFDNGVQGVRNCGDGLRLFGNGGALTADGQNAAVQWVDRSDKNWTYSLSGSGGTLNLSAMNSQAGGYALGSWNGQTGECVLKGSFAAAGAGGSLCWQDRMNAGVVFNSYAMNGVLTICPGFSGAGLKYDQNGHLDNTLGTFKVGGKQVVGAQQAAIANHASDATVNAILGALRTHGLIAA